MKQKDFTTSILVDKTPGAVYKAINHVRGWWSEAIEGSTDKLNEVFFYHYQDKHKCVIKVTELVPGEKVVWKVLDNYFQFTEDSTEWTGTEIIFKLSKEGKQTALQFTHKGLTSEYECFDVCKGAWTTYIQKSLYHLITTGKGEPNERE
jgi:hypothetical protein